MTIDVTAPRDAPDPVVAAIDLLARQGYEATTVDEIADAAQISRSTFFRRYKSKDDIVFADHELLLDRVTDHLQRATGDPLLAVCAGARIVFEHHVRRRDTSVARHALLHTVPALRDRELVTSHRYERAFTGYLHGALPDGPHREYGSVAFSAAVVAVHNVVLRQWLRDPATERSAELDTQLRSLTSAFGPLLQPTTSSTAPPSTVVVAVFDGRGEPQAVLDAIRSALH